MEITKDQLVEILWFIKGSKNIKFLLENNCHTWTKNAYNCYLKKLNKHYITGGDIADENEFEKMILKDLDFSKEFGESEIDVNIIIEKLTKLISESNKKI